MGRPLICLSLTCPTLWENAELVERYAKFVDVAELRVDFLTEEEQLVVRKFPSMIKIPCILTIRRVNDKGQFTSSEFSRTALFGRALAFANRNPEKNFAYVDFEEDFHIPSLEDAALAFGVKIIRSCHKFDGPITNIREKCESMRKTGYEIPKLVFTPRNLSDVTKLFKEAESFTEFDHILHLEGPFGIPSRILSYKIHSYMTYSSPRETLDKLSGSAQPDPMTLTDIYNFRNLSESTEITAITGNPLNNTSIQFLHNVGYRTQDMDRVLVPMYSTSIIESLEFAEQVGVTGMAIAVPFNKEIMYNLEELDAKTAEIDACNTIIRKNGRWIGHDTNAYGFQKALSEFLGVSKLRRKKVSIIGAGGAAHAIAYTIKQMGGKACVFNRTIAKAKILAERYGFSYAALGVENISTLEKYSDIIIQTTDVGQYSRGTSSRENNPLWFYQFKGHESLFELIYFPEQTPIMKSALEAGCKVCNGLPMLKYQTYSQFKHFTGREYKNPDLRRI